MAAPFKLYDAYGKVTDRGYNLDFPPGVNPDTTTDDQKWDYSLTPWHEAMRAYRSVSRLFVSARGLTKEENDVDFPPQLIWTTPSLGTPEISDFVSMQFDEGFNRAGFGPIIDSLEDSAMRHGYCIAEIEWYKRDKEPFKDKIMASFIWDRDPERYDFDPPDEKKPGLYRKNDTGFGYTWCDPNNFMSYAYRPKHNNPYGEHINKPVENLLDTFIKVWGYWRHGLEKAGLGAWVAMYDPAALGGDTADAKLKRAKLLALVQGIASGSASIFPNYAELKNEKLQSELDGFVNFVKFFVQTLSLLYTGSPTALIEGDTGSYSKEESTTTRSKQAYEILDAMRVCAFWNYVFIPILVDLNFGPERIKLYPTLQLIPVQSIAPTTPDKQDTMDEIEETTEPQQPPKETKTKPGENAELMAELQEEEEPQPPVAIPAGYQDFPNADPLPDAYKDAVDFARDALKDMEVREYETLQRGEGANIFTVKRLRNYTTDVLPILNGLKTALNITLDAESEKTAWEEYYDMAVVIFNDAGIKMDPSIRNDLNISFRQARQTALSRGVILQAQSDPAVVGLRIVNRDSNHHHPVHVLWNNIAIPKDHPELQPGGRLVEPMDFGCICGYEKVYSADELTPEGEWPKVWPGETYKYYAQPGTGETQVQ